MDFTEKKLSSEPLYKSHFVAITRDRVQLPNGHISYRVVVNHSGAAAILAITDQDEVILVKQYRYAVGQELLEIPAGRLELGEDPAVCAAREFAEETPYTPQKVELIQTFYSAPGYCSEKMYLYKAIGVEKNSQLSPDKDEFVEAELLSRSRTKTAIEHGQIKDLKTLFALNLWLNH